MTLRIGRLELKRTPPQNPANPVLELRGRLGRTLFGWRRQRPEPPSRWMANSMNQTAGIMQELPQDRRDQLVRTHQLALDATVDHERMMGVPRVFRRDPDLGEWVGALVRRIAERMEDEPARAS